MSRRRGRRSAPRGLPIFGRGFGGMRGSSSSSSSDNNFLRAMLIGLLLIVAFGIFANNAPPRNSMPDKPQPAMKPDLKIIADSWESFVRCEQGALVESGRTGYGNMSIEMLQTSKTTYDFTVTANGFEPAYFVVSYINNEAPENDIVAVVPYSIVNGERIGVEPFRWEHPMWEYRFLIFKTTSGEVGTIWLLGDKLLYGVAPPDARNFCFE